MTDPKTAIIVEHSETWRIGIIEGFGAAGTMAKAGGLTEFMDALVAEMRRRFGAEADEEIARRGLG